MCSFADKTVKNWILVGKMLDTDDAQSFIASSNLCFLVKWIIMFTYFVWYLELYANNIVNTVVS